MPVHHNVTAAGLDFAGEQFSESRPFVPVFRLDRNPRPCWHIQRDVFEDVVPVPVGHRDVPQRDVSVQVWRVFGFTVEQRLVDHSAWLEPFCHDFPPQRHVLHLIVVGQQFLPRS